MNIKLENKILLAIKDAIKDTKYDNKVMVVGGYVRDLIMGIPSNDIDLLIDGDINAGIDFAIWFCKKMNLHEPLVYGLYGTAMFNFMGEKIECVAPRAEKYKDDSRNPIVTGCSIEEECLRRDFTINSMFINISTGELYDFSGEGLNDIKNHVIRATSDPNIIFAQDALRIMRCVRFCSRYGWNIESSTYNGIKNNVERIKIITQERITDEINKILLTKKPSIGLKILKDTNLLELVLPEVFKLIGLKQNKFHFADAWGHTLMVVDNSAPIIENRLAALFHDIGKIKTQTIDDKGNVHFYKHEFVGSKLAENILKRMKYSNDIISKVCFTISNHMRTKPYGDDANAVSDKAIRKLQCDLGDNLDLVLDVINADNNAHSKEHCMPNQVKNIYKRIDSMKNPSFSGKIILPVNGDDIITIKNIKPSPIIKEILDVLKDKFLENPDITKEECIEIIKNY